MTRGEFIEKMRSLLTMAERGDRAEAAEEFRNAMAEVYSSSLLEDDLLKNLFLDMEFLLLEEGTTTIEEARRDLALVDESEKEGGRG